MQRRGGGNGDSPPRGPAARRTPTGPTPGERGRKLSGPEVLARKIQHIQVTTGVPLEVARLVALGRLDLNEAIKRMAFADEVTSLITRHGLDRALATQVALGHADLDRALRKRRVAAFIAAGRGRDVLEAAAASGVELVVGVHGRLLLRVRVAKCEPYEIHGINLDNNEAVLLHKTRLKFACEAARWQKARKAMVWDSDRKARTVEPILRPQERFACSNGRLGEVLDRQAEVTVTLVEGEVFVGPLAWVGRWEVGLRTKGGDVVIFRHAIDDLRD